MTLKSDTKFEEKPIFFFINDKNLVNYRSLHWRVTQNLKKNGLLVSRMTWAIDKFSPEHLKISKSGLWWDPFVQSRKCMSLKLTNELYVMTKKNDAKFEEE